MADETKVDETKSTEVKLDENTTVSAEEFFKQLNEKFDKALADSGVGKSEFRHGVIPVELTEREKALPVEAQNRIKVNKFFRAIYKKDLKYLAQTKAINTEGTPGAGGYLTNPEFSAQVFQFVEQYGLIRAGATKYKMNSQKLLIPVGSDKVTGAFVGESNQKPESNPTFTQAELSRKEYALIQVISKQLMEDSEIDISPLMALYVAEDFYRTEDSQGFLGTGSPINGIVSATGLNKFYTNDEDFGAEGSLSGDQIIDLCHSLSPSRALNAALFMHRTVLAQVRKLKGTDGQYLWQPLANGDAGTLCGVPVKLSEVLNSYNPAAPVANTPYIIYGSLRNVFFGDRNTIEVAMTTDATIGDNNLFEQNLVGFRYEESFDIKVPKGDAFSALYSKQSS